MPISGKVHFYRDLYDVSIYDDVAGRHCLDKDGKPIDKATFKAKDSPQISAVPYGEVATITIKGTTRDAKGTQLEKYEEQTDFRDGATIHVPRADGPKTIDLVNQFADFREFANQIGARF